MGLQALWQPWAVWDRTCVAPGPDVGGGAVKATLKKTVMLLAGRDLGGGGQVNVSSAVWFYQCFLSILLFCSFLVIYLYKCCLLVLILRIDLKAMT